MISKFLSSLLESFWTKEFLFCGLAAFGGLIVLRGLWLEYISTDESRYENIDIDGFRALKAKEKRGELLVIKGIWIEVAVAVLFAAMDVHDKYEMSKNAAKNNPLLQPVSQVSATLLLTVGAATYNPHREQSMANTYLNFGSGSITNWEMYQVFALGASEGRYWTHDYVPPNGVMSFPQKIVAYTIGLRFEQPAILLPFFVNNSLENTNDVGNLPEVTVTNALNKINVAEAYIDFLPTNTIIISGKGTLSVNGFRMDFNFHSNSLNRAMSEYNPDKKGVFLEFSTRNFSRAYNR